MIKFKQITQSLILASKGQENFNIVKWYWGVLSYIICFFLINKILTIISIKIIASIMAYLVVGYYVWHIYASIKCAPKIPKLTKEEKEVKRLKEGGFGKKLMRKLLLQESFSKLNPRNLLVAIDLFMILHFITIPF